ncbi:hypothetical protein SLS60_000410 [Paraconiothyrium brasiliense]|uniref:Bulb-type lectin domain-containing protein n=1 Tax=Paraconiothyrium brasiliense TaxID=300254 RepID=A0ABR3S664_9PLEO
MRATTISALLLLFGAALAVPEVQIVPSFPGTCTAYPSLNLGPGPDRALPFQIISDQADDSAANLLTLYPHDTQLNGENITYLAVNRCTDCAAASTIMQCRDALVTTYTYESPYIRISKDANNAIPWSKDGYTAGIYRHTIGGVDQGHNYWGAQNKTTWGFKVADDGSPDHYKIKLMGLPEDPNTPATEAEWEPEFLGFVRSAQDRLLPGEEINNWSSSESLRRLISNNDAYKCTFTTDGNLVVTNERSGSTIWQSNTAGKVDSPREVILQKDANLVANDADQKPYWATNTGGKVRGGGEIVLVMQDDGNLVLYGGGKPIWKTDTAGK